MRRARTWDASPPSRSLRRWTASQSRACSIRRSGRAMRHATRRCSGSCRKRRSSQPRNVRRSSGMSASIETRASWVVASVSLVILGIAFGSPWVAVVALKTIAAETGGARSVPAFASSLAWFGSGLGGIAMGWVADRYGVRWTVLGGTVMIAIGLAIASFGHEWLGEVNALYIGHGVF